MENINFRLTENETQSAKDWMNEHKKTCSHSFQNGNLPATGEHYYYKIIPGGLGHCVSIGCLYCKVEKDITDFDCW